MDAEKVKAAIEALKNGDNEAAATLLEDMLVAAASGEDPSSSDSSEDSSALAENPDEEPEEEEYAAVAATALSFTGFADRAKATKELGRLAALGRKAEAEAKKNELATRQGLVSELVKLGVETPATAWAGNPEDRNPAKHLCAETVDELADRVKALAAVRSGAPEAPKGEPDNEELTESEKRLTKGMTSEQKERFIEARRKARGAKN